MKSKLFFIIFLLLVSNAFAQVAVNTDGSAADPSAMLDVKSNTAGILIPRMTAAQRDAISNSTPGLMVFVTTDSSFYFYKNSGWQQVGNGASYWHTGNGSVFTDSLVGIGTNTPNATLDIYNSNRDTTLMISLFNNDNDNHYGLYNHLSSSGTGWQYGIYNKLNSYSSGTNPIYGIKNYLSDMGSGDKSVTVERNVIFGAGDGHQTGISQQISNSGDGYHYGLYNDMEGTGSGHKYGVYNYTSFTTGGSQYGVYSSLNGSSSYPKYGVYNDIPSSAGGTHYGTYNNVPGSTNYAGYFLGRMYMEDKVGIGNTNPQYKLDILGASTDNKLVNISLTNNDNNYHDVVYCSLQSSGSNYQRVYHNYLKGTGSGDLEIFYNTLENDGTSAGECIENSVSGSGGNSQFCIYQYIDNSGNGEHYGIHTMLSGSGTGNKYGIKNLISTSTGGTHYGTYNDVQGSSNYAGYFLGRLYASDKAGFGTTSPTASLEISNSTNDTTLMIYSSNNDASIHYGLYNKISSSGIYYQYGLYNDLHLSGTGSYGVYGIKNYMNDVGSGNRMISAERNYITGSGGGMQIGINQEFDNSGSGQHYGFNNYMHGSGTGNKYGIYNLIDETAGGIHYGIYNDVQGSSNYAAFFVGRMYVSDKVGFGTTSPNEQLEVANWGGQGRMIVSDGGGSSRNALLFVSPDGSNNARIESYYYGTWTGEDLEINTVGAGSTIFGGDAYPLNNNSKDLGTSSNAWQDIYGYTFHDLTMSFFANGNVSKEMLRFPPKAAGRAADGSAKLDISSLPAVLTDENGVLLNKMTTFNYQANYEQEVEIKALKEDVAQQKQEINDLKKMVEEQKEMINLLLGQQKK